MITLVIESSNPSACAPEVALASHDALLGVEPLRPRHPGDESLLPAIDALARTHAIEPRAIARVVVSLGPGGYTSLRVAVAAAKMIALACGATCVGVPTAIVAAVRARLDSLADRPFAVALASKGEEAHVSAFAPGGQPVEPGGLLTAQRLDALHVHRLFADRFLPASFHARAAEIGLEIAELRLGAQACWEASRRLAPVTPADLAPLYPRPPEAVRLWQGRTGV